MKNFALIGVGGYIAPRHLQAIKDTGNRLEAAVDPHDSVGILDRYFPDASFFVEFERFDRHIEKLKRGPADRKLDYISICSPNYLHDAHIRFALRIGAHAICEKPLVIKPWNLDALQELEQETGGKVSTILQLRLHPVIIALRESLLKNPPAKKHEVLLTYVTSRGPWYHYSWKGDVERSGGLATNIGIHFFDLLLWLFGRPQTVLMHLAERDKMSGYLELERANVRWFLSTDRTDLPEEFAREGKATFRCLKLDGNEVEFSEGFTNLHTKAYEEVLAGRGFGIAEARPSLQLVHNIGGLKVSSEKAYRHPFLEKNRM